MRSLYIMNKKSAILFLLVVAMLCPASVQAQERDPFFPDGPRSGPTASASQDTTWGRDPFSRHFEGKPSPLQPVRGVIDRIRGKALTGIIHSKQVRVAIIGGETYREGSMVGDQKLVDIKKRSVVLMNGSGGYDEVFLDDFSIRK